MQEHGSFARLFDRASPGHHGHVRWRFGSHGHDANHTAKELLKHVDKISERIACTDYVFLSVLELDFESGRFPDALVSFVTDPDWDHETRFFVSAISKPERSETYCHADADIHARDPEYKAFQAETLLRMANEIRDEFQLN